MNERCVISGHDVESVYSIPQSFVQQGIVQLLEDKLNISIEAVDPQWPQLVERMLHPTKNITIAVCGKYTSLEDSYASILEALRHCGAQLDCRVNVKMIDTTVFNPQQLSGVDAVIVPGGFGNRGIEGKIAAIKYCRENNIPFLGICLGLQLAVIEFMRHVCGVTDATSEEFDKDAREKVIAYLPGQRSGMDLGGTMRLGAYVAQLVPGSRVSGLYGSTTAVERHRHRYEVNPKYHEPLRSHGMSLSGMSPDGSLVEFIDLESHRYFVATQAHPELQSRLEAPNPLFFGLVKEALATKMKVVAR